MMTDKTKKILFRTLLVLGFALSFGALICEIISDCSDVLPENDIYRAVIILGWSIAWSGAYLETISAKQLENGPGCYIAFSLIFMVFLPLTWLSQIEHFTVPVVTVLAISAVLTIVNILMAFKKSRQIKAMIEDNEKNQG